MIKFHITAFFSILVMHIVQAQEIGIKGGGQYAINIPFGTGDYFNRSQIGFTIGGYTRFQMNKKNLYLQSDILLSHEKYQSRFSGNRTSTNNQWADVVGSRNVTLTSLLIPVMIGKRWKAGKVAFRGHTGVGIAIGLHYEQRMVSILTDPATGDTLEILRVNELNRDKFRITKGFVQAGVGIDIDKWSVEFNYLRGHFFQSDRKKYWRSFLS